MGEAKRRQLQAPAQAETLAKLRQASERVSSALQRLATASSAQFGGDCYFHAELGRLLLQDLGFEVRRVVGLAAWRVGAGDGDVIAHVTGIPGHLPVGEAGLAYHAWLAYGDHVIDFTTYQLRQKAAALDSMDGGTTTVDWCPPMLFLNRREISSYKDVANLHRGLAYYEVKPELDAQLADGFTLDPEDLATARLILANPQMQVIGPRNAYL